MHRPYRTPLPSVICFRALRPFDATSGPLLDCHTSGLSSIDLIVSSIAQPPDLDRKASWSGTRSNRHFVCILRMAAFVCQLVPDAFVRIPSPERSSAKSPCGQVNESSSPLQSLIIAGKIPNGTPSPPPAPQLLRLCASVNSQSRNIFNGLLLVPVNEKIPALNSI